MYVIDSLAPGGAETSLAEMAPGLVARGVDLHVLPLGPRLDLAPRLELAGAVVHSRASRSGRPGNIHAVLQVARRVKPALVHTTLFESDVAGRVAARMLSLPSSTSLVSDSYGPPHYAEMSTAKLHAARVVDAATARFATRFHAITAAIAQTVPPRLGIPVHLVDVVPRGRDPRAFPFRTASSREHTKRLLGIPSRASVIVSVGRLEPPKGHQHLLRSLPGVAKDHPDVVVLIAGKEGRSSQPLRQAAARLGLDIRFLGHRDDVPALLAAADAFCFPSEREGFGGVLIEALAVGCPVVASALPTTVEILGPDPVGLMVPVGDAESLARALSRALSDRAESARLADRGRERFEELFTIDRVDDRMTAFFTHVADGG